MAESLKLAAETGDINGLYGSIKEDPHVLDHIDAIPFVDTPLHIAASRGHTDFALEILRLKPSFGRKLNPDGRSSLHLALRKDKFETVKQLIKFDKELIRIKGMEGVTPLHFIAKKASDGDQQQRVADRIDILAEFLCACPNSVEDLTIRDQTALHIAVKSKNQKAVDVILGCICRIDKTRVLYHKDKIGKTALRMAEDTSQDVASKSLRARATSSVWWIQIVHSLCCAGALECSSPDSSLAEFLNSPERPLEVVYKHIIRVRRSVSVELRNIVLVAAVLIATATFTAVLSPPGGVGGPGNNNLLTNGTSINAKISSTNLLTNGSSINATNHLFAANTSFINATFFIPTTDDPVKRFKLLIGQGTYEAVFLQFYCLNTVAFVLSMLMIMFALPFGPFAILHIALYSLMLSYGLSFSLISPSNGSAEVFLKASSVCAFLIYIRRYVTYQICLTNKAINKRLQMLERLLNNVEQ